MIFVCTLALIQKYKEGQNAFCGHPSIRTPVHSSTQRASMKAGERQGVVEELKEFLPPPVFPSLGKGGACRRWGGNNVVPRSRMLDVRGAKREGTLRVPFRGCQ